MDFITDFDIQLEKELYYAGEQLLGNIIIVTTENLKVQGVRVHLRGKTHAEWKINKAGERRTVKQDEYYIDEKCVAWGKDRKAEGPVPILPRGNHKYPFEFKLPETNLPCSFESKIGTIRYYLRVVMDMPYASSPQGIKYFTIIGPHIDCMDEKYLSPIHTDDKFKRCCMCCAKGPVQLKATMERSAYCCGENIRVKADVINRSDETVWLLCRLTQFVEYFIDKGVLGLRKSISHQVWEYKSQPISPYHTKKLHDLRNELQVPVMPPTLVDVCNLIQIYYTLNIHLVMEKTGEVSEVAFPLVVATLPYRIPNSPPPQIEYEYATNKAEGGIYISSEFQFGQVYMGDLGDTDTDEQVMYRPQYVCIPHQKLDIIKPDPDEIQYACKPSDLRKNLDIPRDSTQKSLRGSMESVERKSKNDGDDKVELVTEQSVEGIEYIDETPVECKVIGIDENNETQTFTIEGTDVSTTSGTIQVTHQTQISNTIENKLTEDGLTNVQIEKKKIRRITEMRTTLSQYSKEHVSEDGTTSANGEIQSIEETLSKIPSLGELQKASENGVTTIKLENVESRVDSVS